MRLKPASVTAAACIDTVAAGGMAPFPGELRGDVVLAAVDRAHRARPLPGPQSLPFELGIDANMKMGKFLAALGDLERDLRAPSLHAALLAGGSGLSTYPASSKVQIDRRTVPGETEAQAVAAIRALADRLASEDPQFHATVRPYFAREPFEVSPEAAIVQAVERAGPRRRHPLDGWMDAALCQAAGIETVVFGLAGVGAPPAPVIHRTLKWCHSCLSLICLDAGRWWRTCLRGWLPLRSAPATTRRFPRVTT